MSGSELKNCPFCGGDAGEWPDQNHSTGWDIGCFNDGCDIQPHVWAVHRETARDQWNTRTPDPAQIRADALREAAALIMTHCHDDMDRSEEANAILALIAQATP